MDRHYDASGVLLIDPDGVVTADKLEVQGCEHRVEFLVLLVSCLFQAIQRFVELQHLSIAVLLSEALWSLHEDLMVHLSIEKRIGDIEGVQFQIFYCSNRKNGSKRSPSRSRSEDLTIIESRTLREAFGNKPGLVAVD